jgi:hypothetical protein
MQLVAPSQRHFLGHSLLEDLGGAVPHENSASNGVWTMVFYHPSVSHASES